MKQIKLILISLFIVLFASCNLSIWDDDSIDYGTGTGETSSSLDFTGTAPTAVFATKASNSSRIIISWNGVNGADYYEVYRADAGSTEVDEESLEWERLADAPTGTSYTDSDVEVGKVYAYRVRARSFSIVDLIGSFSDITFGWLLAAPSDLTATQGESEEYIRLQWSSLENIRGYRIQWSTTGYDGDWNTATPTSLDADDYIISWNTNTFDFYPDTQYYGQSIFFRIVSVSYSGESSDPSSRRVGYTRIPGAPSAPVDFTASRGDSLTSITLSWEAMYPDDGSTDHFDWEIYRYSQGESERRIYSTVAGNDQPAESGGRMSYVDTSNLKPGVEYSYSVRAIGKVNGVTANGDPSVTTGFLLSPPTIDPASVNILQNPSRFTFTIVDALGAADEGHSDWKYVVYGRSDASNGTWTNILEIPVSESERTVEFEYSSEARSISGGATSYEYFTVATWNGSQLSAYLCDTELGGYEVISFGRPEAPDSYNVSDNLYASGMTASGGIYPVVVTMKIDNRVDYYNVRIWTTEPASIDTEGYIEKTATHSEYANGEDMAILNDLYTPDFGRQCWIAIQGVDKIGRVGEWSKIDSGYSALTGAKLIQVMQVYCLKPWEYIDTTLLTQYPGSNEINQIWEKSEIYSKVSQAGTGSLTLDGPVVQESALKDGGTITYTATISSSLGGYVTFQYKNFGETAFMKINGSYAMDVDRNGTGSCTGAITITGWYPASIGFENISVESQKFVGTYTVTQQGRAVDSVDPNNLGL